MGSILGERFSEKKTEINTTNVTAEDIEAGRNLLRAAGKIKLKEEIGYYTFYSQAELAELVMDAGFNVLESCLSLGEQAAVIKAGK